MRFHHRVVAAISTISLWIAFSVAYAETIHIRWIATETAHWNAAANWDLDRIPAAGDHVTIPDGTGECLFTTDNVTVDSLTVEGALTLSGGTLAVAVTGTVSGVLRHTGGTLAGDGYLTLSGTNNVWSGGTLSGTGTLHVAENATLTLSGERKTLGPRAIVNDGMILFQEGVIHITHNNLFRNRGLLELQDGVGWGKDVILSGTHTTLLQNTGTIRKSGDTGAALLGRTVWHRNGTAYGWVDLVNDGLIEVDSGVLALRLSGAAGAGSGEFVIAAAAQVQVHDGSLRLDDGARVTGSGPMRVQTGGALEITGGSVPIRNLWLDGGTVFGGGALTLTGPDSGWNAGTLTGTGTLHVAENATLTLSGERKTLGPRTIINDGVILFQEGVIHITHNNLFRNRGQLELQDGVGWGKDVTFSGTHTTLLQNTGTIRKSGDTGTALLGRVVWHHNGTAYGWVDLVNDGLIEVDSGVLALRLSGAAGAGSGELVIAAAAQVQVHDGSLRLDDGARVTGSGPMRVQAGGTLEITGSSVPIRHLWIDGGTVTGAGSISLSGPDSRWDAGTLSGTGTLYIAENTTLTLTGGRKTLGARPLVNDGTMLFEEGVVHITQNTLFQNRGLLELQDGVGWGKDVTFSGTHTTLLQNTGTIRKSGGTGTALLGRGVWHHNGTAYGWVDLVNDGLIEVDSGVLALRLSGAAGAGSGEFVIAAAAQVQVHDGSLRLDDGARVTGSGPMRVQANGALEITGGSVPIRNLWLDGGTVTGDGVIGLTGPDNRWSGGLLTGAGVLRISEDAVWSWTGGTKQLGSRWIVNNGAIHFRDGSIVITQNNLFQNYGLLNLAGDVFWGKDAVGAGTHATRLENTGTIRKSAGDGAALLGRHVWHHNFPSYGHVNLLNNGMVDVRTGTLQFHNSGGAEQPISTGEYRVAPIAELRFAGGQHRLGAGASINGGGAVALTDGTLVIEGDDVRIRNLDLRSGTLTGDGRVTLYGQDNRWRGGTLTGSGSLFVFDTAVLWLQDGEKNLGNRVIENDGTVITTGGTVHIVGNGRFENRALFDIRGDWTWGKSKWSQWDPPSVVLRFNNTGEIRKSAGDGIAHLGGVATHTVSDWRWGFLDLVNTGRVTVESGHLRLMNSGAEDVVNTGRFEIPEGTELLLSQGVHRFGEAAVIEGSGTVRVEGRGSMSVQGGVLAVEDVRIAGTLTGDGALLVTGSNNTWSDGTLAGPGTLRIGPDAILSLTGGRKTMGSRTIINDGTIRFQEGSVHMTQNSLFHNRGLLDLQGDVSWGKDLVSTGNHTTRFENSGEIRKSAGEDTAYLGRVRHHHMESAVSRGFVELDNQGLIQALSGTLIQESGDPMIQSGILFVETNAVYRALRGFTNRGRIEGGGTLSVGADNTLRNAGVIVPGGSVGTLTITGRLHQEADGILEIEVDGQATAADRLDISGATTLGGSLRILTVGDTLPDDADTFIAMTFPSQSGAFETLEGFALADRRAFNLNISSSNAVLSVLTREAQPDLMIRRAETPPGSFQYDNRYLAEPEGYQDLVDDVLPDETAVYWVRLQNDADETASYLVKAAESGSDEWAVTYLDDNDQDLTVALLDGGWTTPALEPGETLDIRVTFSPSNTILRGVERETLLTAHHDAADAIVRDAVRATVRLPGNEWKAPVDGIWQDASKWSLGVVPGAADDAFITVPGDYTVTLDANAHVRTLTLGGASGTQTLVTEARYLQVDHLALILENGVLNQNHASSRVIGGTLRIEGTMDWHGIMAHGGLTVIAPGGLLRTLEGPLPALWNRTLQNYGVFLWNNPGTASQSDHARFENMAGGQMEFRGGGGFSGRHPSVYNYGTLLVTDTTNSVTLRGFENHGEIMIRSATLNSSGSMRQFLGSLTFEDGHFTGNTTLRVDAGTVSGTGTIEGTIDLFGGRLEGDFAFTGSSGRILNRGGVVAPGLMTVSDYFQQLAGGTVLVHLRGNEPGSGGYGRITAGGQLALGGHLQMRLSEDFTPADGSAFPFLEGASRSGTFTGVALDQTEAVTLSLDYTSTNVVVNAAVEDLQPYQTIAVNALPRTGIPIWSATGHGGVADYTFEERGGRPVRLAAPTFIDGGPDRLRFDRWSGSDNHLDRKLDFAVTTDAEFTAQYVPDPEPLAIGWLHDRLILHADFSSPWPVDIVEGLTARITLEGPAGSFVVTPSQPVEGTPVLRTTDYPDGRYAYGIEIRSARGQLIGSVVRDQVLLNDALWHVDRTIEADETWSSNTLHVIDGTVTVSAGVTLTVEPGAVIKAKWGARLVVGDDGTLDAMGTLEAPIVFTSIADATVGGDSLFDGGALLPVPGDWQGIVRHTGATALYSTHTEIRYILIERSGTLTEGETWTARRTIMIVDDLTVPDGITLTIDPGAVIKLAAGKSLIVQRGGALFSQGTASQPIVFTSIRDDSAGGVTNPDGIAPAAGDWKAIRIESGGEAEFAYTTLIFGGGPIAGGWQNGKSALVARGHVRFVNSRILEAGFDGVTTGGDLEMINSVFAGIDRAIFVFGGISTRMINCTLDDNRIGIHGHGGDIDVINTVIANSLQRGVWRDIYGILSFSHCAFWNNANAFDGIASPIGQNGNFEANPLFVDRMTRDYRLRYRSPLIDAADGIQAPDDDILGMPRLSDPRTPFPTGIPGADGHYADIGAFEFIEYMDSDVDLVVTSVSGPSRAAVGEAVELRWTVRNQGIVPVRGPWHDRIDLAFAGDATSFVTADTLLVGEGFVLHPGTEVEFVETVNVPAALPGIYHWAAMVNSRHTVFEGIHRKNNRTVSTEPARITMPELLIDGIPVQGTLTPGMPLQRWMFTPLPGQNLRLTFRLHDADAVAGLYVALGYIPGMDAHDRQQVGPGAEVSLNLSGLHGQPYYLTLHGMQLTAETAYTLTIEPRALALDAVRPERIGNHGNVTLEIAGVGLDEDAEFVLLDAHGVAHPSTRVYAMRNGEFYATFAIDQAALGMATVALLPLESGIRIEDAIEVEPADPRPLQIGLSAPRFGRFMRVSQATLHYHNPGNVDVPAAVVLYSAAGCLVNTASSDRHPQPAMTPVRRDSAFPGGQPPPEMPPWRHSDVEELTLMLLAPTGPAGILRGGQRNTIDLTFILMTQQPFVDHWLGRHRPDEAIPWLDWKMTLGGLYSHLPGTAMNAVLANYRARIGETYGDYHQALIDLATHESLLRVSAAAPREIYRGDHLLDAYLRDSGLMTIPDRYVEGAFGRGDLAPWEWSLSFHLATGDIHVRRGPTVLGKFAGYARDENRWESGSGDLIFDRLVMTNGTYRLLRPDGTEHRFDRDGRLQALVFADGRRFDYEYDGNDRVIRFMDSQGAMTADIHYNAQDLVERIAAAKGDFALQFEYDARRRMTRVIAPAGASQFDYHDDANPAIDHAVAALRAPGHPEWFFDYDEEGRLAAAQSPDLGTGLTLEYPAMGHTILRDHLGNVYHEVADMHGRPRVARDVMGQHFSMDYNEAGSLIRETGPRGAWRYGHQEHRLVEAIGPDGSRSVLNYDGELRDLTAITDAQGRTYRYQHDPRGLLVKETFPNGDATMFEYDDQGILVRRLSAAGREMRVQSTREGNPEVVTHSMNGESLEYVTMLDGQMRVIAFDGPDGVYSNAFDDAGYLALTRDTADRTLTYQYHADGRMAGLTHPEGDNVTYEYDGARRLIAIRHEGDLIATFTYNAAGLIARREFANQTAIDYLYTPAGRFQRVTHTNPDQTVFSQFDWTYDAAGRVVAIDTLDGRWRYAYDRLGRLENAEAPDGSVFRYHYDALGNRTLVEEFGTIQTVEHNEADQLVRQGFDTFEYDADGNLVQRVTDAGVWRYDYDARNRLVGIDGPDGVWNYEYDALGRLSALVVNGDRREFLYQATRRGDIVAEYDGDGDLIARYVLGDRALVCRIDADGQAMFYHHGPVGNIVATTGADGAIANRYAYAPFGELLTVDESIPNPFRFNGAYGVYDDGSGLYHMRARPYDPALGRFIQRDPAGLTGGLPLYAFAANNPISRLDPLGLYDDEWYDNWIGSPDHLEFLAERERWLQNSKAVQAEIDRTYKRQMVAVYALTAADTGLAMVPVYGQIYSAQTALIQVYNGEYEDAAWRMAGALAPGFKGARLGGRVGNTAGGRVLNRGLQSLETFANCRVGKGADIILNGKTVWDFGSVGYGLYQLTDSGGNPIGVGSARTQIVGSFDPNEIIGPAGYGDQAWIRHDLSMPYTIYFENVSTASAPAQVVFIVHQLDEALDLDHFELGSFGWHHYRFDIPAGRQFHDVDIVMPPIRSVTNLMVSTNTLLVRFSAGLDRPTRTATWRFETLDPETLDVPEDPFDGFLPPNLADNIGDGFVSYTIRPRDDAGTDTRIVASADIYFDFNPPIITDPYTNTLDSGAPESWVEALPPRTPRSFPVFWHGIDDGAGIAHYDIYVSREGAPYQLWQTGTPETEAVFEAEPGVRYRFFSVATDNVGHREGGRSTAAEQPADALTTTEFLVKKLTRMETGEVVISWESAGGLQYRVLSGTNLTATADGWLVQDDNLTAQPPVNTITNIMGVEKPVRFFRIERVD